MAGKNTSVFGIYPDRTGVEEAVNVLCGAGFRSADISVLLQENQGTKDFAHVRSSKAPEGAVAGAVIGGIIGAVLGWLISAGTISVPSLNGLTTAGPVYAALAGLGALGILGLIIGGLAGMSTPEYEAKRFQGRLKRGGALLSVHCDNHDWVKRAKSILKQTGAENIGSQTEAGADFSVSDKPMLRTRRPIVTETTPSGDNTVVEHVEPTNVP